MVTKEKLKEVIRYNKKYLKEAFIDVIGEKPRIYLYLKAELEGYKRILESKEKGLETPKELIKLESSI